MRRAQTINFPDTYAQNELYFILHTKFKRHCMQRSREKFLIRSFRLRLFYSRLESLLRYMIPQIR